MIIRILLISFVTAFLSSSEDLIPAKIGEKEILLKIANTQASRADGLMGVKALEYNQGMIFIWPNASRKCMCCLLYTSPSPRDKSSSRMPSSA